MFRRIRAVLLVPVLAGVLASCSRSPEIIHILTDRKELAAAVEIYDAANPDVILTIRHVESIESAILEAGDYDLVIGAHLNAEEIIRELKPLGISISGGYDALDGPPASRGRSYLLPLSFRMPVVAGLKSSMELLPDRSTVRPEELKAAGLSLRNIDGQGRLTALGFSPSWNPLTFVDLLMARNPSLLEGGLESMEGDGLDSIIQEAGAWIFESTGGSGPDAAFSAKYRYAPDQRLLNDGRIRYVRMDLAGWNALTDSMAAPMDIRYFRGERRIPVTSVVSAAVPRSSGRSGSAEGFISWLTRTDTQEMLMRRWERDGIVVFGFLGGLSANSDVNQGIITDRYPEISIPEPHYLSTPVVLPDRWLRIRDEVLAPWLAEAAAAEADRLAGLEPAVFPGLTETWRIWDLSSLDETP